MKVTISGVVHATQDWKGEIKYEFFQFDMTEYGYMKVCEHAFEVEIPDNFNPIAAQVESLNAQKTKLQNEFNARVREINDQIANLQCIEYNLTESV